MSTLREQFEHRQSTRNDALHIKAPTMIAIKIHSDLYSRAPK